MIVCGIVTIWAPSARFKGEVCAGDAAINLKASSQAAQVTQTQSSAAAIDGGPSRRALSTRRAVPRQGRSRANQCAKTVIALLLDIAIVHSHIAHRNCHRHRTGTFRQKQGPSSFCHDETAASPGLDS
jgi:hypothetical protein